MAIPASWHGVGETSRHQPLPAILTTGGRSRELRPPNRTETVGLATTTVFRIKPDTTPRESRDEPADCR